MSGETDIINEYLADHPTGKWGFVIYRCTYAAASTARTADEEWAAFMAILNARVSEYLEEEQELMASLDWSVQEDRELEGASTKEVRR